MGQKVKKLTSLDGVIYELRKGSASQSTKVFVCIAKDMIAEGLRHDDKTMFVLAHDILSYSLNLTRFHKDKTLLTWIKEEAKKLLSTCLAQRDK